MQETGIINQSKIESGFVFFDERVFENKGFFIRLYNGGDYGMGGVHQKWNHGPVIGAANVLTNSRSQSLGFSNIKDLTDRIQELIHSG